MNSARRREERLQRRHEQRLRKRIAASHGRARARAIDLYLKSSAARAVVKAPPGPWGPPVKTIPNKKKPHKTVEVYSTADKARQRLLHRALRPEPPPAFWSPLVQYLEENPKVYGYELDIVGFFDSVNIEGVPLPAAARRRLTPESCNVGAVHQEGQAETRPEQPDCCRVRDSVAQHSISPSLDGRGTTSTEVVAGPRRDARKGISCGAASSPAVADLALSTLNKHLPTIAGTCVVRYVDNVLVLARTQGEAETLAQSVRRVLETHPAGGFKVAELRRIRPEEPFEFLGYEIDPGPPLRFSPSLKHLLTAEYRFQAVAQRVVSGKARVRALRQRISSWLAGFPRWDSEERKAYLGDWVDYVTAQREVFGLKA